MQKDKVYFNKVFFLRREDIFSLVDQVRIHCFSKTSSKPQTITYTCTCSYYSWIKSIFRICRPQSSIWIWILELEANLTEVVTVTDSLLLYVLDSYIRQR